ncbi:hypothetical protein Ddc_10425 [Ditylenchus destructor]|nr:hypothetical protein Ddc_10425 [Ditylenchus destructor]
METWYSRDPVSSTQAAFRLIFNIDDCVDTSRVLQSRPTRPPDSKGRETYVYLMDGSSVRNIRDLPIDDLAPWNSRKCKSSTRFNAICAHPETGSMVLQRYIVSDTENVPDRLLACYYCKHPTFHVAKKIFYACDGRREGCLPGTFVVFVYEFDQAETLVPQGYACRSNESRRSTKQNMGLPTMVPVGSNGNRMKYSSGDRSVDNSMIEFGHDLNKTQSAIEALFAGGGGTDNGDFSMDFGDIKADLMNYSETCDESSSIPSPSLSSSNKFGYFNNISTGQWLKNHNKGYSQPYNKRRKMSIPQHNPSSFMQQSPSLDMLNSASYKNSFQQRKETRTVFVSQAMLENFQTNGLCEATKLSEYYEQFDEQSSGENGDKHSPENNTEHGGCALLDTAFNLGKCFVTVLWFRNHTFLEKGKPVIHPIAVLISDQIQQDDLAYLFAELETRINNPDISCRALLLPENVDLEANGIMPTFFNYPCLRLNCAQDFRMSVERRFSTYDRDIVANILETDLFGTIKVKSEDNEDQSTGLLNSLKFETFVKRLALTERRWPAGIRTWLREKSGWVFERLSLGSRLKAGFGEDENADLGRLTGDLRDELTNRATSLMDQHQSILTMESIVTLIEDFSNDLLIKAARSILRDPDEPEDGVKLNSSKDHMKIDRTEWLKSANKKSKLAEIGLGSVLFSEIAAPSCTLDAKLFRGLSRAEKAEVLSKAYEFEVMPIPTSNEDGSDRNSNESSSFIVIDRSNKASYFVSGSEINENVDNTTVSCQCQYSQMNCNNEYHSSRICEHLCAVAIFDDKFGKMLINAFESNSAQDKIGAMSEMGDSTNGWQDNSKMLPSGIQLQSSAGVEIIRCLTSDSNANITEEYREPIFRDSPRYNGHSTPNLNSALSKVMQTKFKEESGNGSYQTY